jgi:hypothetical protein
LCSGLRMAAVTPTGVEGVEKIMEAVQGDGIGDVVMAMFRGLAAGGATRHVVAATAAAVVRLILPSGRCGGLDHVEAVEVPFEVAGLIRPVAAAMAVQKIVGNALGTPLPNAGLAYGALRHADPALATQVRTLCRVANIAKHGVQRGGRHNKELEQAQKQKATNQEKAENKKAAKEQADKEQALQDVEAKMEAEEMAKEEEAIKAQKEAAKRQAENKARQEADEKAKTVAEEKPRREAEEKAEAKDHDARCMALLASSAVALAEAASRTSRLAV